MIRRAERRRQLLKQTYGRHRFSTNLLLSLGFLLIILVGTLLLMLPASSRCGTSCGLMTALFTATSATCVTGLSLVDVYSQFSTLGQVILLCLIEV